MKTKQPKRPERQIVTEEKPVTMERWEPTGLCFFCHEPIETDQNSPSEATTRHVETKVKYGGCRA